MKEHWKMSKDTILHASFVLFPACRTHCIYMYTKYIYTYGDRSWRMVDFSFIDGYTMQIFTLYTVEGGTSITKVKHLLANSHQ